MESYKKNQYLICFLVAALCSLISSCHRDQCFVDETYSQVWSAFYSNNGLYYNVATGNGFVSLYCAKNDSIIAKVKASSSPITTSLFSSDDSFILLSSLDSCVNIYTVPALKLIKKVHCNFQVYSAMFLSTNNKYAACGSDSCLYVFNSKNDQPIAQLKHPNEVNFFWLAFKDSLVITTCKDGNLYVWDLANQQLLKDIAAHNNGAKCVYINTNGTRFVSTGNDSTVKIWDMHNYSLIKILKGHKQITEVAMYNANNTEIASCDEDGWVIQWNATTGAIINKTKSHTANTFALHYSLAKNQLITGSIDGSVVIRDLTTGTTKKLFIK